MKRQQVIYEYLATDRHQVFDIPSTGRQVYIEQFLRRARKTCLHAAVATSAQAIDSTTLRKELIEYVPSEGLTLLQGTGVRDEEVFIAPSMLRHSPGIITFYRLLLGISQKQFYTSKTGLARFKPLEERQEIPSAVDSLIDSLCREINTEITKLFTALPSDSIRENIDELPIMTLGAQADGSWRTQIGQSATNEIFEALKAIVKATNHSYTETRTSITVVNNSGRRVTLMLAPDPDVVIHEDFGDSFVYKAAIEIKGGTDYSNIHNRAGEAEKSHQKARQDGAQDCWTVISLEYADTDKLRQESPTTREWFDLGQIRSRTGDTWERLDLMTRAAMGI